MQHFNILFNGRQFHLSTNIAPSELTAVIVHGLTFDLSSCSKIKTFTDFICPKIRDDVLGCIEDHCLNEDEINPKGSVR